MYVTTLSIFSYEVEKKAAVGIFTLTALAAITLLVIGILAKNAVTPFHIGNFNTKLLLCLGTIVAGVTAVALVKTKSSSSQVEPS